MPQNSPVLFKTKFRDYQISAIQMVRDYIGDFRGKSTSGAALVCHPTGTGKTAVVAGLSQCCKEIGNVLVLSTREAIRDQLSMEISSKLFLDQRKFALKEDTLLAKNVYCIREAKQFLQNTSWFYKPTSKNKAVPYLTYRRNIHKSICGKTDTPLLSELKSKQHSILVMTVYMLDTIRRSKRYDDYRKALEDNIDLILFDEGHYEPAASWSEAVRSLGCPMALLSATPFRNDLRPFEISEKYIDILKFKAAQKGGHIREVKFFQRNRVKTEQAFCADISDFIDSKNLKGAEDTRIIIHCDSAYKIKSLAEDFLSRGFDIVAIHDTFTGDNLADWQYKSVPPPGPTSAQIWIHQYKLMEGIDDHRFKILAFFDSLSNSRAFVQQVGRVLRRKPDGDKEDAFVLDHFGGKLVKEWQMYLDYDAELTPKFLAQSMLRLYLNKFRAEHPKVDYFDRKFRRRFDLDNIENPLQDLSFPRQVTLKLLDKDTSIENLALLLEETLADMNCQFKRHESDQENVLLYAYAGLKSPDFLVSNFFAEIRHYVCAVVILPESQIVAFSSSSRDLSPIAALANLSRPRPTDMRKLLNTKDIGRVNAVTSLNSNLANKVVRRRSFTAPSIAELPPQLDEYAHVLSNMSGYNGDRARIVDDYIDELIEMDDTILFPHETSVSVEPVLLRRYIGVLTGRVSEAGPRLRLVKFLEWINDLAVNWHAKVTHSGG